MIIRRMSEADIHQVSEIEKETFSQPWSAHAFEESVRDDNAVFLVAEDVGEKGVPEIVGYIGMYVSAPEGEITNVAVAENVRGKGFGKALVSSMQKEAETVTLRPSTYMGRWAFRRLENARAFTISPRKMPALCGGKAMNR